MTDVVMPKLSDSMEEGTILIWLKAPGDQVAVGDELLEIETDKATVIQAAEAAGVLEIIAAEGTTVSVGDVIARIGVPAPAATPTEGEPLNARAAVAPPLPAAPESQTAVGSSEVVLPAGAAAPVGADGNRRSRATPMARRIAAVHGVAVDEIEGTGPLGRTTRSDVLRQVGIETATSAPPPVPRTAERSSAPAASGGGPLATPADETSPKVESPPGPSGATRQQLSRLQQLIARRMSEAKATIPHFQVQTEVVMDAAVALRADLKQATDEGEPAPSLNDMVIKAAALALRHHPLANGSYQGAALELHDAVNIGVAVAAENALVVPTVFDAARKALGQIARETHALAARGRSGEITPPELSGATFTVSNLGMFGMTAITPVINPPQAAILGVGAIRDALIRHEGEIVDRSLLTLTLSCDHRILYGADAARFLASIRELLQTPLKLVL